MLVNHAQRVTGHFPDESLELSVVEVPCFDFGHQVHRDIDGAGFLFLFERQMPAGLGATGPGELAEGAFEEGADLGDAAQGGGAQELMAIFGGQETFHL